MRFDWRGESGIRPLFECLLKDFSGKRSQLPRKKRGDDCYGENIVFQREKLASDGNAPDLIPFALNVRAAFAYHNKTSCLSSLSFFIFSFYLFTPHAIVHHKSLC